MTTTLPTFHDLTIYAILGIWEHKATAIAIGGLVATAMVNGMADPTDATDWSPGTQPTRRYKYWYKVTHSILGTLKRSPNNQGGTK